MKRASVTLEGEEDRQVWNLLSPWAMSDVESDDEGKLYRTLPWRKAECTELIRRIDELMMVKRRYDEDSEQVPTSRCHLFGKEGVELED